ncbi:hypothetical protein LY78DRAFT_650655 [Colletotrichum sublineola]|nr:hypothetical protein LY78DRAFT_650655 [Colletotrichum sublineola]
MSDQQLTLAKSVKLHGKDDWPVWFQTLKSHAEGLNVWEYIDPDAPDAPQSALEEQEIPTIDSYLAELQDDYDNQYIREKEAHQKSREDWENTHPSTTSDGETTPSERFTTEEPVKGL